MKESLEKAKEELKRVDHLIYVSLKYTRTCDVFKSIIERLINAIDFMIESMLKKAKEDKKLANFPPQPRAKCLLLAENLEHEELKEMCNFYLLLRQIDQAPFTRDREYRRHVTMTVNIGGKKHEVDIDNITAYYKKTKVFYDIIEKIVHGKE
ncbi:hypothetical protein COV19_04765 [Candidatus Woesearchaeota archaeon CG10_big_fil_rev_8_21_14_0_10_44_13]|nr:MAG: hypothetical protein COV19_04765 [Candidatus Woesearchaeota archaeon CG10_big_fil_rev_8_21_14_0_10_44_13]